MKPRSIITTGAAFAVALILVGGVRFAALADHHGVPTEGDRRPAAEAENGTGGAALGSDPAPHRTGAPDGRRSKADGDGRAGRRSGNGGRSDGRGSASASLTDEQVEEAVALMIELDPAMAPRIEQLRAERPALLRVAINRRLPRLGYMLKLKESRPDFYALRVRDIRLENRSHQQARALAALPEGDPGADAARTELRGTLNEHFTVRQQIRRVEIEMLREKLVKMEAKLGDEEGRRDAFVEGRLAKLEAQPPPPADVRSAGDRRRGRRGEAARGDEPRENGQRGGGARGE